MNIYIETFGCSSNHAEGIGSVVPADPPAICRLLGCVVSGGKRRILIKYAIGSVTARDLSYRCIVIREPLPPGSRQRIKITETKHTYVIGKPLR